MIVGVLGDASLLEMEGRVGVVLYYGCGEEIDSQEGV